MQAPGWRRRRVFSGALAALGVLALGSTSAKPAAAASAGCTEHILEAERELEIPRGLLLSMSLVESGQSGVPQPLAMNVNGKTVYPDSLDEARRHLLDGRGNLRSAVIAGCMQLSVQHHRTGFKPIERVLDPAANVWYAARYLKRLRADSGNWGAAVARYNGGSRSQQQSYMCRIGQHLAVLEKDSADLLDSRRCGQMESPSIAPETRRAFRRSQVASADVSR